MAELTHHCEVCGDEGTVYLSPRCHLGMPVFCLLTGDVLTIECAICRRLVGRLQVSGIVNEELPEVSKDGAEKGLPNDQ